MTNKRFYIALEVPVQISGDLEKDTEENRKIYWNKLMDFANTMQRKLDYSFYIHGEHVLTINDEKGRTYENF